MTGRAPIEFWFDFSSGYAYFAAQEIETLGRRVGRAVLWRPYMLGAAFEITGMRGLSSMPMKSEYAAYDWKRIARLLNVPLVLPADHPKIALAATRAFYWIDTLFPDASVEFARTVFREYYKGKLDTSDMDQVAGLAGSLGLDPARLASGALSKENKQYTKEVCGKGIARGVFGSPFFLVDEEVFWGWDRMRMMEDWLQTGGW